VPAQPLRPQRVEIVHARPQAVAIESRLATGWAVRIGGADQRRSPCHDRWSEEWGHSTTIIQRHQLGVLSVGEEAYAYTDIIQDQVSDGWSQGHWERTELGTSPTGTPARAESTLVDSLPVLLDVCGSPKHYILARGCGTCQRL
jgi:hypothetical protein